MGKKRNARRRKAGLLYECEQKKSNIMQRRRVIFNPVRWLRILGSSRLTAWRWRTSLNLPQTSTPLSRTLSRPIPVGLAGVAGGFPDGDGRI